MSSTNGTDPAGLPYPISTPTPNRERFRLRVEVFLPQDAHSYDAKPYHSFIIAKGRSLDLPELSLRELRDVVVYRYKTIYPNETLFQISKTTNALGDDLFLDDSVGDIFADNEVFRVIKGASIRESLPRNYRESREASLQPSYQPSHIVNRKRSPNTSNVGDLSRAGKRQRFHEPERPIPSIERFAVINEEDEDQSSEDDGQGDGQENEPISHTEDSRQGVEAPTAPEVNGANVSAIAATPIPAQTPVIAPRKRGRPANSQSLERTPTQAAPTSESQSVAKPSGRKTADPPKKRGRPRKSLDTPPSLLPEATKGAPVSTSPIPPPKALIAKNGTPTIPASATRTLDTPGPAKTSQMLPPSIIPQRQPPRPMPTPDVSDARQKLALGSSPANGSLQAGPPKAKKDRMVSFVEPSPAVIGKTVQNASAALPSPAAQNDKTTNGGAPDAVVTHESSLHSQAESSDGVAAHEDAAHSPLEANAPASATQHQDAATPNSVGKLGKRKAATISVYKKEELARESVAAAEKAHKEATREAEKKLAAEKKAEKEAAKEAEKKLRAKKKAEKAAAKEAKAAAKAVAKEAKQKAKNELKLASSSQKETTSAMNTSEAPAPTRRSASITDAGADTLMSGITDDEVGIPPTSPTAPAPHSIMAPPSSPTMPAETARRATPESQADRSPSEASSPDSVSTSRSQRDSRSPVHFVTANSKASKGSFPGSGQKQGNSDESESEEGDSSDEDDDDLNAASAVKPKTPAQATGEKADVASTQSIRSTSHIPPPSQPRFSDISSAYKEKTKEQHKLSTTPIQPQPAKLANHSFGTAASRASDSPAPSQSQRPAAMAHLPSLKSQTAQAVANRHAEMERIRLEGQARAKAMHDETVAKRQEEKVEESEADTDSSSSDSDSDSDGSSSDSDAKKKSTPKNKRLMGLNGGVAPASASKAEGKKKKTMSFGAIKKRHSMGGSLR